MTDTPHMSTAVILAGGEGRRLFPLTATVPKPLVPIGNRTVIEYLLDHLARCGVTQIHLAVNHRADQIRDALGDGSRYSVQLTYHIESTPLSTIGPLSLVDNLPERFFVLNGDIITNINFQEFGASHLKSGAIMSVVVSPRTEQIDYGVIETNENKCISAFIEKPAYSYLVSTGIYCMSRNILTYVPKNQRFGFDQLVYALLEKKETIHTHALNGYWLDIGRHDDYERACKEISTIRFDIT